MHDLWADADAEAEAEAEAGTEADPKKKHFCGL